MTWCSRYTVERCPPCPRCRPPCRSARGRRCVAAALTQLAHDPALTVGANSGISPLGATMSTRRKVMLSMEKESKSRQGRREKRNHAPVPAEPPTSGDDGWPDGWPTSITVSQYETYFRIACASYRKLREIEHREIDWPTGSEGLPDAESMRRSSYEQRQRFAAVAVIFSALTLESFINHYGSQLDLDLFNALDRSNAAKWQLFPLLRCGKKIASGTTAMNGIGEIFRIRDRLVHDKPHEYRFSPGMDPSEVKIAPIDLATKQDPITHVRNAVKALKEIDPAVEIGWAFEPGTTDWSILL